MIEEIQFFIAKDHYTYSFDIESDEQFVCLDQSLRPSEFSYQLQDLTQIISKQDFHNDLKSFLRKLNTSPKNVDTELIQEVFIEICEEHIRRFGRLWYSDLLIYADLYINIDRAIYHRNEVQYKLLYKKGVNKVLEKFSKKIYFPNPMENSYLTWEDIKD